MTDLSDQTISNTVLVLERGGTHSLGPNLYIDNCRLRVECASEHLIMAGLYMRGGHFDQKSLLMDRHFSRVHFERVAFTGAYAGVDFGGWDDADDATIVCCTFENATLSRCRFLRADVSDFLWPATAGFVIHRPSEALGFIRSHDWPAELGLDLEVSCDIDPECSAIAHDSLELARADRISIQKLHNIVRTIPNIQFYGANNS